MTPKTLTRPAARVLPALVLFAAAAAAASPGVLAGLGAGRRQTEAAVARVQADPAFQRALAILARDHDRMVADTITLTEIPAPPFKEDRRGAAYLEMLRAAGLTNIERDAAGNVMGRRKGTGGGPLVVIAAHLDTVFPEGTDVHVRRDGTRLMAPGVGDDSRSLAVLLAMARAMNEAGVRTSSDILFVGDVGEEGPGDLRGMKQLFLKDADKDRIGAFISMDGTGSGEDITNGAVGSLRYHVTFSGPGGHSYGDFGLVNPAFALGNAMAKIGRIVVPKTPRTTYSVGIVSGGTSVNSIPHDVSMDVDLRSESPAELAKLDRALHALVQQAVDEENAARSTDAGRVSASVTLIGQRPSGVTPESSRLARTAAAAVRAMGMTPAFHYSSTDANIPISLGIPAVTIASGGTGDRVHALDEWIDVEKRASLKGIDCALLLLVTMGSGLVS